LALTVPVEITSHATAWGIAKVDTVERRGGEGEMNCVGIGGWWKTCGRPQDTQSICDWGEGERGGGVAKKGGKGPLRWGGEPVKGGKKNGKVEGNSVLAKGKAGGSVKPRNKKEKRS